LENSIVRAAAVSALAKFGVNSHDEEVRKSVRVLLNRCLDDVNDEVRDRATLYLSTMDNQDIAKKYVTDGKKGENKISAFLLILVKILHTLCQCLSANLLNTSTIHMKMQKNSSLIQFQLSANRKKKKNDVVSLYKEERMRSI
jgi:leucyl-tRNA synthetase